MWGFWLGVSAVDETGSRSSKFWGLITCEFGPSNEEPQLHDGASDPGNGRHYEAGRGAVKDCDCGHGMASDSFLSCTVQICRFAVS